MKLIIVAGIFGIIGTLLGAFIAYRLSLRLARIQAKHAENLAVINAQRVAGAKLRAAFASELGQVEILGLTKDWLKVESALKAALPKHSAAIEEYRWLIPPENQGDYQQAWEDYCETFEGDENGFFSVCTYSEQELFIERIEAILKFTETLPIDLHRTSPPDKV